MAATQPITESIIREAISKAVQDVFKTMIRRDITLRPKAAEAAPIITFPELHIMGNVGFVGKANGVVYLCLSEAFANFATGEMLGMSPGEIQMHGFEVVKDAIGEVSNMTVGGFKNQLCDIGFPCMLTLPTIVRGRDMSVSALVGSTSYVYEFDCAGHRLVADIQIKPDTPA